MSRFILTIFAALAVVLPASAQFYGGSANYAPAKSQATARGLSGMQNQGANITTFAVGGGGGYYGGGTGEAATPWSSQYGSYIQPSNSGIQQDAIARQQAYFQGRAMSQDVELRRLQLKRATFDEMMYEKMNTPPPEVVREEQRQNRLTRARNNPPDEEIWSGTALNDMLTNIQRIEAREGVRGYAIPVDPETLKYLNVSTTGGADGSNEIFKASTRPEWPIAFATDDYSVERQRIEDDIKAMMTAQQTGRVDLAKATDARKAAAAIRARLYAHRLETSFSEYAGGLEFLNKLENTIATLAKPGAKNFVDGTYAAKGDTVGDLINYMTSKGLKFAAATPGFEPYYSAFYQQLVTYDIGLARMIGDQSTLMFQPTPPKR